MCELFWLSFSMDFSGRRICHNALLLFLFDHSHHLHQAMCYLVSQQRRSNVFSCELLMVSTLCKHKELLLCQHFSYIQWRLEQYHISITGEQESHKSKVYPEETREAQSPFLWDQTLICQVVWGVTGPRLDRQGTEVKPLHCSHSHPPSTDCPRAKQQYAIKSSLRIWNLGKYQGSERKLIIGKRFFLRACGGFIVHV